MFPRLRKMKSTTGRRKLLEYLGEPYLHEVSQVPLVTITIYSI